MAFWHDYLKWEIFEFPGGQTQNWRTMGHWLEEESHTISETKFFRQEEIPNPVGWWSIVGETMCQSWDEAWWCVCAPWMASTFWTAQPTGECLVKGMNQHCTSIAHSFCAPYRFSISLGPKEIECSIPAMSDGPCTFTCLEFAIVSHGCFVADHLLADSWSIQGPAIAHRLVITLHSLG